jgi:pimeloyl-ACP methyl ester carboxylesterase
MQYTAEMFRRALPKGFLFREPTFSFEALRAAGFAAYGGADLGEVMATASRIGFGGQASWHRAWKETADRVSAIGESALDAGHLVSGREALLRASNYYRTAEFFLRACPANDPDVQLLSRRARKTFAVAVDLLDAVARPVRIPYCDTTLPAYLFCADDSGAARPTVIYNSGYDSTLEESYFAVAAAALRRGYNVLAFDGPGQGAVLREQGLVFRPDWETVISPVLDYAVALPETDTSRIALFGYSLGALLVARAAAFDGRIGALILDDGLYDFHEPFAKAIPSFLNSWIERGWDRPAHAVLSLKARTNLGTRWGLQNGVWAMGASSYPDLVRKTRKYTLAGVADRVTAPTLVMDAEDDHFLQGQARRVHEALTNAPSRLATLYSAEGAGEHCHMGALTRAHQVMFDWLDESFAAVPARPPAVSAA